MSETKMSPERKKIPDRLTKILALAEGSGFDAEADTARRLAQAIMAEHGMSAADVEDAEFELRVVPSYFDTDVQWDRIFKWAIARLNNCAPLIRGKFDRPDAADKVTAFLYVGCPLDIDAALYMTGELIRQRGRAFIEYAAQGGADGNAKFFFGYAKGLEARIEDILARTEASMAAQGKKHLGPSAIQERELA
jgi:hypothetical protein